MAEVHIIGQIVSGDNFECNQLFCKFGIFIGKSWILVQGKQEGQTQIDNSQFGNKAIWSHPIDAHYATKSLIGWPKLWVEVYSIDRFERAILQGYGCCYLPTTPGLHTITCATWRPRTKEFRRYFLGESAHIKQPETILMGSNRYKLQTLSSGTVHSELYVILRNFEKFCIAS